MILRFIILFSIIIIAACDNSTSQTANISSEPLSISLDKVNVFKQGKDEKLLNIKLNVEGGDVKNIEGYKFTELFVNGEELERGRHTFVLEPIYESPIKDEEYKNWFKPSKKARMRKQYVRKRIENNIFHVPALITEVDRTTSKMDIKGELTLIVASEENRCAYRIKDFLAKGKLTDKPLEFNGGNIKFIHEPMVSHKGDRNVVKLLLEDTERLLFDIYFEDATGKERREKISAYGRPKGKENIYYAIAYFNKIEPNKDWTMVVVYAHENCRITIPFEFKNIDISL